MLWFAYIFLGGIFWHSSLISSRVFLCSLGYMLKAAMSTFRYRHSFHLKIGVLAWNNTIINKGKLPFTPLKYPLIFTFASKV
jgi:hypothetical protein